MVTPPYMVWVVFFGQICVIGPMLLDVEGIGMMGERPTVVDLFCGAGGLSAGFLAAGFDVRIGVDFDSAACETFAANHEGAKVLNEDIRKVSAADLLEALGGERPDVVIGGPSCQGFSTAGPRDFDDPRNIQFREFVRLVGELQPRCIMMENVVGLLLYRKGVVAREICTLFGELGYNMQAKILLAADFGVPQLRRRVFFIGTRSNESRIAFPRPTHADPELWAEYNLPFADLSSIGQKNVEGELLPHRTVADAISDLPPLEEQGGKPVMPYGGPSKSDYQKIMRQGCSRLFNHETNGMSDSERKMVAALKPGDNWRALPPALLPARFKKIRPYDASTLIMRMRAERPAYTITTKSAEVTSGAFIHPAQNRTLSVREAARLQSFPDRFRFYGTHSEQRRQIGNSVPPMLAKRLAEAVRSNLTDHADFDGSQLMLLESAQADIGLFA